ncbi:MAG: fructose-1,6-bisphosphatase [Clostridia bacterium]|nr:fructose-1,6-bisphosphatase [Clostridia bacterium]
MNERVYELLSSKYPDTQSVLSEIINLETILNLPKGTEHFLSDVHGEYGMFSHILRNCSGVIREKTKKLLKDDFSNEELSQLCTLIYYPEQVLEEQFVKDGKIDDEKFRKYLEAMIKLARFLSSKYTRKRIRSFMPSDFAFIIDELINVQSDEDIDRTRYHGKIVDSILENDVEHDFAIALTNLIKTVAVDHLHIVGDVYDRGPHADKIMDILKEYHSYDVEWGNHDILWLGAASGNLPCIAAVLYNNIKYNNLEMFENGYGISLREFETFADTTYSAEESLSPILKAARVILMKTEGEIIKSHPEFNLQRRLIFEKVDFDNGTVVLDGKTYELDTKDFPTVDRKNPYKLTEQEEYILQNIKKAFVNSKNLQEHMKIFLEKGSLYKKYNGNLLFHGCIPMNEDGEFSSFEIDGVLYKGKELLDKWDNIVRLAFNKRTPELLDYIWYLWSGSESPVCGREIRNFENTYLSKNGIHFDEPRNHYYKHIQREEVCRKILKEFDLDDDRGHIINGHTPVITKAGESPVKANGKLLVIDGGFCKAYQKVTGIAGYTLISNSHCLKIKEHHPFSDIDNVLSEYADVESETEIVQDFDRRQYISDTDKGLNIKEMIADLKELLEIYRNQI